MATNRLNQHTRSAIVRNAMKDTFIAEAQAFLPVGTDVYVGNTLPAVIIGNLNEEIAAAGGKVAVAA